MSRLWRVVTWALRLQLSALFLWAGFAKLIAPRVFVEGVQSFQVFPDVTIHLIVMTVPVLELIAAVLLLIPRSWRIGALLVGLLSLSFTTLFAWAAFRGVNVECSCFGATALNASSNLAGLVRGGLLLAVSGFLYITGLRHRLGATSSRCGWEEGQA